MAPHLSSRSTAAFVHLYSRRRFGLAIPSPKLNTVVRRCVRSFEEVRLRNFHGVSAFFDGLTIRKTPLSPWSAMSSCNPILVRRRYIQDNPSAIFLVVPPRPL